MEVEPPARDLHWLKAALQSAVELEFATLPVYLIGMWSIIDQEGEVFDLVDSVVREEMLHLGLACNMLKAIGGSPQIRVPSYPGHLPGGVRPELTVFLAGLSKDSLAMYMEIERPEHPLTPAIETFPSIGRFYDAVLAAFRNLAPTLTFNTTGQLTSGLLVANPNGQPLFEQLKKLASLADVEKAIATIKEQGEGTSTSPDALEFGKELAHFYRFGEILHGKKLKPVDGEFKFEGDPVPMPPCHPVAEVPEEGYPDLPETRAFDESFSTLVADLQHAWDNGSQSSLGQAIGVMSGLYDLAKPLVEKRRPNDDKHFGPDFKLLST